MLFEKYVSSKRCFWLSYKISDQIASLQIYGSRFCGGTIIGDYHVLTAAHCCKDLNLETEIVVGEHSRILA
jgi:secreted trypsin-like serine protease